MSSTKTKTKTKSKKSSQDEPTIDVRMLKALGHPLRQRILYLLNQDVSSPNEIANKLNEPLGNVSYHVKILAGCDAIELVRTAPVRGALEHFYRATMRPRIEVQDWRLLPESTRDALFGQTLQQISEHVRDAATAGGFDDPRATAAWVSLELDDEAFEQLTVELSNLLDRAMELHTEAAVRLASLDKDERADAASKTELALLHFHRG